MQLHRTRYALVLPLLLVVSLAVADTFQISWWTVDGGGGAAAGKGLELDGTIGQPDASPAGALTGGGYSLTGGFWAFAVPACESYAPVDYDRDCDVDHDDFMIWASCARGSRIAHDGTEICQAADFDGDNDVDQTDFAAFQRCFTGPGGVADPNCGG